MISISVDTRLLRRQIYALGQTLDRSAGLDATVRDVAQEVHGWLKVLTPIKWTGNTRKSWIVRRNMGASYTVTNTSKIMLFLEVGTRAHGPVRARFLYIPLKPGAARWNSSLIRGVDYILTKRVRGIRARKIVEGVRDRAAVLFRTRVAAFVARHTEAR